jgi:hypothetical protein
MKYTLLKNKETGARSVRINSTNEVIAELDDPKKYADLRKKALAAINRKNKDDIMESMGLTKVRGSVSGKIYWE